MTSNALQVSITGCVFLVGKWAPHFKWSRSYIFHPTETEELKEAGSHNVRHLTDCEMITELTCVKIAASN